MLDDLIACRHKVRDIVRQVWAIPPGAEVFIGRPMLPVDDYPNARIRTPNVPMEFTGARNVTETFEFEIEGLFIPGATVILDDERAVKAKALGEALMAANWAEVGCYMPMVPLVQFPADDLDTSAPYAVILNFSVRSDRFE